MMGLIKKQRASSVLGLSFDGSRLEGIVLRRANGSAHVTATMGVTLALDPLSGDPELVGREIRNHLDAAEIRERRCAVCLPLGWALTLQTKLPELPEADVASILQIEAERGFPYGPEALLTSRSRFHLPHGGSYATQVAVPRDHVLRLEKVLRAAHLIPATFSLGLSALQSPDSEPQKGILALALGENGLGLQLTCGGGIVALRTLDSALEMEGAEKRIHADMAARELRITLGQLPEEVRAVSRHLRIFGSGALPDLLARQIAPRAEAMGLMVERVTRTSRGEFGIELPSDVSVTPALGLAARYLAGQSSILEFLPPKISAWQQLTAKYSSRKLVYAGTIAGALAFIVALAFIYQQAQLSRLGSQWAALSPKVRELEDMQRQIRQYRPWFDESVRTLSILRRLTEAFPQDGSVTAKTIEIRELALVTCAGTARDNDALTKTLDQLRAASDVVDVQVGPLRGKSPLQFTFNFQWGERSQP